MPKLPVYKDKILEFLYKEFSNLEYEFFQQKASKKLKSKILQKKIKKLQKDIELILKTNAFKNDLNKEIIELQQKLENSFLDIKAK